METNGVAYSRENRQMIIDMKEDIKEIKEGVAEITNHYSKRIPPIVALIISSLTGLLGMSTTLLVVFIKIAMNGG